ncbi:MAG: F0F1 ATP synthase subunit A [Bacteroidota bacterium]
MRKLAFVCLMFVLTGMAAFIHASESGKQQTATQEEHHGAPHTEHEEEKGFEAGKFMFDHIADAYEWHILTFNGKHVSLPLPVILYSKNEGLVTFMSGKLHHGHSDVQVGNSIFRVAEEGHKYDGKIIEVGPDHEVTKPFDISITKNIASLFFSVIIILWIFLSIAKRYRQNPVAPPRGFQSLLEPIILFIRDEVAKPSIGKKYDRFLPFLLTLFFFIWINNMLGLVPIIPGGANLTGNISVTLVLALFTFLVVTFSGNRNYWKHMFNTPGVPLWLKLPIPLMPLIEVFGAFTKPFVLMVRLFANITAGHIIVLGFLSLIFLFGDKNPAVGFAVAPVTIMFNIFMGLLELLVAFIQAYVFTFLSALYIGMAVEEHH